MPTNDLQAAHHEPGKQTVHWDMNGDPQLRHKLLLDRSPVRWTGDLYVDFLTPPADMQPKPQILSADGSPPPPTQYRTLVRISVPLNNMRVLEAYTHSFNFQQLA